MVSVCGHKLERKELQQRVGCLSQIAGIKALQALDGRERGARMLDVRTGSGLFFRVMVDRCLDISACQYKGASLVWHSSVGEVHPAYYEPQGFGWLRSFPGGLLATCGLDQFGPPSQDGGNDLALHGRIGNTPARCVSHSARWVGDDYVLEISGEVRQTRVFGEYIVLDRHIRTTLGSRQIVIEDAVSNRGFDPHPHMILYHFNFGFPLVSAYSQLRLETEETIPRDEDAAAELAGWRNLHAPRAGYREQVFRHVPAADEDGLVAVEIENQRLGLGARLSYNRTQLPYLYQWKMLGEGAYVLGLEPANCGVLEGRDVAQETGQLGFLEPSETLRYSLQLDIIDSSDG